MAHLAMSLYSVEDTAHPCPVATETLRCCRVDTYAHPMQHAQQLVTQSFLTIGCLRWCTHRAFQSQCRAT